MTSAAQAIHSVSWCALLRPYSQACSLAWTELKIDVFTIEICVTDLFQYLSNLAASIFIYRHMIIDRGGNYPSRSILNNLEAYSLFMYLTGGTRDEKHVLGPKQNLLSNKIIIIKHVHYTILLLIEKRIIWKIKKIFFIMMQRVIT